MNCYVFLVILWQLCQAGHCYGEMAHHQDHSGHHPVMTTVATLINSMAMGHSGHMAGEANTMGPHAGHTMDAHTGHTMDHNSDGSMGGMDHSGHGAGHMMMMWFHVGYSETVLFESWSFNTIGGLIGSMIGIFFMAALYEGIKYYREYLFWKTYNSLQYRSVSIPTEKGVVSDDNQIVHVVGEMIHKQPPTMFSWMHVFQTFLHIVQMVLSYFLMLIFMTYNVWLCIAVVAGAALGYFLFGWKKSVIVDVTEHCH